MNPMNTNPPKPPKVVVAPEGCPENFTEGKEYEVIRLWDKWDDRYGYGFIVKNDDGNECDCIENGCFYLNLLNWIIKEREQ